MAAGDRRQYRIVCFTDNNPDKGDADFAAILKGKGLLAFAFQMEVGANGTPHRQGVAVAPGRHVINTWKRILGHRCHIEGARGTIEQNVRYCTKEETRMEGAVPVVWPNYPDEWPEEKQQGKRSDLDGCADLLKQGYSLFECFEAHPGTAIRYHGGLARFACIIARRNRAAARDVKCYWLGGEPGVGKSWAVVHHFDDAFRKSSTHGSWWDGYDKQQAVIWDDLDDTQVPLDTVLEVCDKYRTELPVKGGMVPAVYTTVIITSNKRLEEAFATDKNGNPYPAIRRRALERRFEKAVWCETREEVAAFMESL